MNLSFYYCDVCGKVIAVPEDTGVPTECCGQPMEELLPNRRDGDADKHVPVFERRGSTCHVQIGQAPHPMTDAHGIRWIGVSTSDAFLYKELTPGGRPEADFFLGPEDEIEAVYAYCNLHGLWCLRKEVKG